MVDCKQSLILSMVMVVMLRTFPMMANPHTQKLPHLIIPLPHHIIPHPRHITQHLHPHTPDLVTQFSLMPHPVL